MPPIPRVLPTLGSALTKKPERDVSDQRCARRMWVVRRYVTPAEAEEAFYANLNTLDMVA